MSRSMQTGTNYAIRRRQPELAHRHLKYFRFGLGMAVLAAIHNHFEQMSNVDNPQSQFAVAGRSRCGQRKAVVRRCPVHELGGSGYCSQLMLDAFKQPALHL